jgi:hypothetical protein
MSMFQPSAEELHEHSGPATEVVARGDLLFATRGVPDDPWSTEVFWARWNESEIDRRITEVLDYFRPRRQGFVWRVADHSSPASLVDHLAARGFIREMECQMLVATLPITGLRVNPSVIVREVVDRAGLEDAERVQHPDWDADRLARRLDDRMSALGTDQHFAVAYLDDRPVGNARWLIHRTIGAVEFNGAETLVAYRERGVYSTLAAFRAARAAQTGCHVVGINADRGTSAPILLKRGFQDLGPITFFLWPASRF